MTPAVTFKTIGCRLNQAETAGMAAQFTAVGYRVAAFGEPCDAAVIHGCAITAKAERDSLRAARQARRTSPHAIVILAGCPAETAGDTLRARGEVDLVVGQAGKSALPALLHRLHPERFPPPHASPSPSAGTPRFDTRRAFVKVQDGCDFRCAYCIVPAARGRPISRPVQDVLDEIRRLTLAGFKEVVLTGANLGCYADGAARLVDLVREAERLPDVARLRLSSIEITTAERPIVDHMAASAALCHSLHIPLQSGDDGILAAMGRRYTTEDYRRTVEYALARVPDVGLGTDVIVGFPGEDDRAFANTMALVRSLPFSNLHVFPYSRRPGTRADTLGDQVSETVKKKRVRALIELGVTQRAAFAESFVGKAVDVLIEEVSEDGTGHGWTGQYVEAFVAGVTGKSGEVVRLRPDRTQDGRLFGSAATSASARSPARSTAG
jgi:threonylcarbamoyladenosine tRNA methylthiotransferase MtaB